MVCLRIPIMPSGFLNSCRKDSWDVPFCKVMSQNPLEWSTCLAGRGGRVLSKGSYSPNQDFSSFAPLPCSLGS